jgi:hypothetical protein
MLAEPEAEANDAERAGQPDHAKLIDEIGIFTMVVVVMMIVMRLPVFVGVRVFMSGRVNVVRHRIIGLVRRASGGQRGRADRQRRAVYGWYEAANAYGSSLLRELRGISRVVGQAFRPDELECAGKA